MIASSSLRAFAAIGAVVLVIIVEIFLAPPVLSRAWQSGGRQQADRTEIVVSVVFALIASVAAAFIAGPRAWFVGAFLAVTFGFLAVWHIAWALIESGPPNRVEHSLELQQWTVAAALVPFVLLNLLRRSNNRC